MIAALILACAVAADVIPAVAPPAAAPPVSAAGLAAQGSVADYQRSAELRGRFSGLLNRHDVRETWLDDGRLAYTVSTEDNGFELVLVDPMGEPMLQKQVILKTDQLQEFLKQAGLTQAKARVARIASLDDALQFLLADGACVIQYNLAAQSMELVDLSAAQAFHLEPRHSFARSRDRGGRSAIYFQNRLAHEVEMLWVDPSGKEKSYGKIAAGEDRWLSTLQGHGFRLQEPNGKARFHFVAEAQPGIAIVAESNLPHEEPTGRRQRPRTDSPDSGRKQGRGQDGEGKYRHKVDHSGQQKHLVSFVESAPKGQLQPKLHQFNYLKPGDDLGKWTLSILGPGPDGEQRVTVVDNQLFATPWSLNRFQWSADGSKLRFLYNQRGHQVMRLLEVDGASGEVRTLIEESSSTFVDYAGKTYLRILDDRGEALWMSERDGWNHLYLVDLENGGIKRQLTSGEWMVRKVEKFDAASATALIQVMGYYPRQDPYHVHYASLDLNSGELTMLTDGDGTHTIDWSPDGNYFLDRYSRVDMPMVTELRSRSGELVCQLERGSMAQLVAAGWRMPQRYAAVGRDGKTLIWGVVYRPTNFNPHHKYPVVESIYAGPHGAHVPKSFSVHRSQAELAELGFIVVQIDGMGTNWRGKKFHDVAWKNLQDAGFPDRKLWMKSLAEKEKAMDLSRVGIYGGSAGGQNAMRALIDHHDFYHVAIADCGCHDNRMDKIWWNELWMSWPVDDSYAAASNVDHAHRMQGDLLLIVGEVDRNVDPASTMQVVDALIKADKDFELLVMPGAGHGASGSKYGTRRLRDFLVRKLMGVEPRWATASAKPKSASSKR